MQACFAYGVSAGAEDGKKDLPVALTDGLWEGADGNVILPQKVKRDTDKADRRRCAARPSSELPPSHKPGRPRTVELWVVRKADIVEENIKQRVGERACDKCQHADNVKEHIDPVGVGADSLILNLFRRGLREHY